MNHRSVSQKVGSPTLHASIAFTVAVFLAILVMSYVFKVEIVAKGIGKVVPLERVQVVQPEFGGQLRAIHVRDGMRVAKGDIVIELDPTNAQSTLSTLTAEEARLEIERLRIQTVISVLALPNRLDAEEIETRVAEFNQNSLHVSSNFFIEQSALLSAELTELRDALAREDARIHANARSKDVTLAGITRIAAALETQQERLDTTRSLLERGAVSRARYLDVLDGYNGLEREREILLRELDHKTALDAAYLSERSGVVSSLRSRLQLRRAELEARASSLNEELKIGQRRLTNTKLLAPTTGIVDQLSVFTIGGIVDGGQELLRIVPEDQEFEVEAIFPNADVGFLKVGQKANIKLDAYPSERFGVLRGEVSNVSADAIEIDSNVFGFVVRVKPKTLKLESVSSSYLIQPGMTSTVDIVTGSRRLVSYFFAPIVKVVQESLGER